MEITQLRGRVEVLRTKLDSLKRRSAHATSLGARDPGSEMPATEQALSDAGQRLQKRLEEQRRLTLTAPIDGSVLPPRRRPIEGPLTPSSRTEHDAASRGTSLLRGCDS